jgi:hypothetical protein
MVEYTSFSQDVKSHLKEVDIKLKPRHVERILHIFRDRITDYKEYLNREEVKNNDTFTELFKELLLEYEEIHQTIAGQVEDINTQVRIDNDEESGLGD